MRRATLIVSLLAILGFGLTQATMPAFASTTVTGTTSMTNVPDTTNAGPGTTCVLTPNGYSWATDQFPTVTLTAVPQTSPANTWQVTIVSDGSFAGFADPLTCDALAANGSITGSIQYTVTSATAPVAGDLHQDYSGFTQFTVLINDFFGHTLCSQSDAESGNCSGVAGGDIYSYAYQSVNCVPPNGLYTQVGSENGGLLVTGDVAVCAAPTPSPTPSSSPTVPPQSTTTPTGGVQTGGGIPEGQNVPLEAAGCLLLLAAGAVVLIAIRRRRRSEG